MPHQNIKIIYFSKDCSSSRKFLAFTILFQYVSFWLSACRADNLTTMCEPIV
jgi:hypothetical protein